MATMLTWQSDDGVGLESARVLLNGGGFRAVGRMIRDVDGCVFTASYRLAVGDDGAVQRLVVDAASAEREKSLTINRSADGDWLVDDGSGNTRLSVGGALDVDLAFSPVFNTIPIRRLDLHREESQHTIPVAFVSLPDLTVELAEQTYRTVSAGAGGAPAVVGFSAGGFAAEITVDDDGLVLDYPGIARRAELATRA
ncbi:hypothetical protein EV383_0333 [Pseudonocardia sediminis]|uniref:Glycolipid-binding protein n=1 Tax=Pseudonocardia sediminis TaxID=1397368 RepID=A0A4Q7URW9_PSEST|nr:putative glycolipid-binding domain-containing protein [Pseudonocardia sediminis]RZT83528.1 hypothetical protein EV383_0333 [Pseudonocardia sediminis]